MWCWVFLDFLGIFRIFFVSLPPRSQKYLTCFYEPWVKDHEYQTSQILLRLIYCTSSISCLPVFPERLLAIHGFCQGWEGGEKRETGQIRGVSTVKTKCKMPVGKRFTGLNLALIYLLNNTACLRRDPPSWTTWKTSRKWKRGLEKSGIPAK